MKQHIGTKQLEDLTSIQLKKLHDIMPCPFLMRIAYQEEYRFKINDGGFSDYIEACERIDIGRMIEALTNNHTKYKEDIIIEIVQGTRVEKENKICDIYQSFRCIEDGTSDFRNRNLCDILWEAIVTML